MRMPMTTAGITNELVELIKAIVYETISNQDNALALNNQGSRINQNLLRSNHSVGTRRRSAQNLIESNAPKGSTVYSNPVISVAPRSYNNRNNYANMKNKIIYGNGMSSRQFVNKGSSKQI